MSYKAVMIGRHQTTPNNALMSDRSRIKSHKTVMATAHGTISSTRGSGRHGTISYNLKHKGAQSRISNTPSHAGKYSCVSCKLCMDAVREQRRRAHLHGHRKRLWACNFQDAAGADLQHLIGDHISKFLHGFFLMLIVCPSPFVNIGHDMMTVNGLLSAHLFGHSCLRSDAVLAAGWLTTKCSTVRTLCRCT